MDTITQEEEGMSVIPSSTAESSKSIQAIDKEAVHRICSGQVVLNLATAMKELVENSLDAGATSIEIRLKEYGSELVEVHDNGCGVEESNLEGLTLKHHTSKLKEFSDLLDVATFGFRGEALSSLCALSELTVTTRHSSSAMGTKLMYDSRGLIISRSPCARQAGTSVALANLFSPLPVRQKEFLRNLKREFVKMSQLLHAYCLISTGVKIQCSNQTKKGGKTIVVSTQGSQTFKGNIMSIFGAKQTTSLLDIEIETPSATHLEEIGLSSNLAGTKGFQLEGYISSCAHGQGRSSTDRQFYYINTRPCDPIKVSKVVNEVYHHFNVHQFPFVFLNIKTARDSVDVNVTPDKRQIFLDNEKLLIATVKASLLKVYEKVPNTYQVQNIAIGPPKSSDDVSPLTTSGSTFSSASTKKTSNFSSLLKNFSHSSHRSESDQSLQQNYSTMKSGRGVKRTLSSSNYERDGKKQLCLSNFVSQRSTACASQKSEEPDHSSVSEDYDIRTLKGNECLNDDRSLCTPPYEEEGRKVLSETDSQSIMSSGISSECLPRLQESKVLHSYKENESKCGNDMLDNVTQYHEESLEKLESVVSNFQSLSTLKRNEMSENDLSHFPEQCEIQSLASQNNSSSMPIFLDHKREKMKRRTVTVNVNMEKVHIIFSKKCRVSPKHDQTCSNVVKPRIRFYAEIDPSKNKNAEHELNKEISKDMFSKMEIIGQFNLGFIITKLGHDLFIVDQHATDEKYNFETLQAQTTLKNQKLVIPQVLDLTAINECILMDNLDIFIRNGFHFVIDKDAEQTKRIRLAAKPISHNWEFGKEDIDELLFMLQDSPHTMCRPSRVRAMFASRACRKSVMIGTALNKSTMRQLVNHMGEIDQPWNCPHGRPTMRHLVNLELVRKSK